MVGNIKFVTVVLAGILLSGALIWGEDSKNTTVETYPFAADKTLTLDLQAGGNLAVTGWDKDEILITMKKTGLNAGSITAETQQSSTGITIISRKTQNAVSNGSLDIQINLPKTCVHNFTLAGGSVTITGVSGDISGKTMGGSIRLIDVVSNIDVTTMGGSLVFENCALGGSGRTMGGGISYNGNAAVCESGSLADKTFDLQTMGGGITLQNMVGIINAKTMGGNIKVIKALGDLRLSTMGGTISVKDAEASLVATTMGGNIDASFLDKGANEGRVIDLSTQGGRIKLAVPKNLAMNIDATIEVRNTLFDFYRIRSSFPLTLLKDEETRNGVLVKLHKGSGSFGSGDVTVRLGSVNGNIDISGR